MKLKKNDKKNDKKKGKQGKGKVGKKNKKDMLGKLFGGKKGKGKNKAGKLAGKMAKEKPKAGKGAGKKGKNIAKEGKEMGKKNGKKNEKKNGKKNGKKGKGNKNAPPGGAAKGDTKTSSMVVIDVDGNEIEGDEDEDEDEDVDGEEEDGDGAADGDADKKMAVGMFVLDFCLVVVALILFASVPKCKEVNAPDKDVELATTTQRTNPLLWTTSQMITLPPPTSTTPLATKTPLITKTPLTTSAVVTTTTTTTTTTAPQGFARAPEDYFKYDNTILCGKQKKADLTPGETKTEHTWPWLVGLFKKNGDQDTDCSATLVSPRHAMTSTSCLPEMTTEQIVTEVHAKVGSHPPDTPGEVVGIAHARRNPDEPSIILLTLEKEIRSSEENTWVCLPPIQHRMKDAANFGLGCFTFGWKQKGILKQVEVIDLTKVECSSLYDKENTNVESSFCAEYVSRDPKIFKDLCIVDRGGPVICDEYDQWVLYGLLLSDDACRSGNLYAQVSYGVSWFCCFFPEMSGCAKVPCSLLSA